MFKLTDNLLHKQIMRNIHLYAPIANILLFLVQCFCYILLYKRLASEILLLWQRIFSPCITFILNTLFRNLMMRILQAASSHYHSFIFVLVQLTLQLNSCAVGVVRKWEKMWYGKLLRARGGYIAGNGDYVCSQAWEDRKLR